MFLLRVISKFSMPPSGTIALTRTNNEVSIAKQARIAAPSPDLRKKTPRVLMRNMAPTANRSLASRMRPSIYNAFDMPRFSYPCRDSKYHRYGFEYLEQSPVNNKQANDTSPSMRHSTRRKPECSIAAKQRTLGCERKFIGSVLQRVAPSTLLACARDSPSLRFALNTNTEGWRDLNRLKNRTKDLP